ncbi:glycosyltransferase family 4 protein [Arthrobacter sp. D2-10]
MKVMHVLLSPRVGGAESFVAALMSHMEQHDFVDQRLHFLDHADARRSRLGRVQRLRKAMADFRPDLIVSHTAIPNLYARIAAPRYSLSVIVLHSSGNDYAGLGVRAMERLLRRIRTVGVVAVSDVAKASYEKYLGEDKRIRVIPNGIPPLHPKASDSYRTEPTHITTLARISKVKNPALWTEVAGRVNSRHARTKFEWYGPVAEGEDFASLMAQTADVERVRFCGPTMDGPAVLENSDVLFHPSDREAHSLTLIEAAMVGLPIVCSEEVAESAGREYVDEVFPAGKPDEAVLALERVLANYDAYAEAAASRASEARDYFSLELCTERYLSYFGELLQTRDSETRAMSKGESS